MSLVPSRLVDGKIVTHLVPSAANTNGSGAALQPIPKRTSRTIRVELNSIDRDSVNYPSATEFKWVFPFPVKEVREIRVIGGTIPIPFLNIDSGWNKFTFWENGITNTIQIPVGHYTITTLLSTLTGVLNGAGFTNTYLVSLVANTGQIQIVATAGVQPFGVLFSTGAFSDTIDAYSKTILEIKTPARILGFGTADYYSTGGTILAPKLPNLWYALERSYLYFSFDSTQDLRAVLRGGGRKEPSAILYHDEYNIYNYNEQDPTFTPYPLTKYLNKETFDISINPAPAPISRINAIQVSLRDMFYNLINTQGREMTLLIELVIVD